MNASGPGVGAVAASSNQTGTSVKTVYAYHYMIKHWGESVDGKVECIPDVNCIWTYSDHIKHLRNKHLDQMSEDPNVLAGRGNDTISISVYNIHSWWEKMRDHYPATCELRTNLTFVESEESAVRYDGLFNPSFKHFDGYSTTHPASHVQRVYAEAFLNKSNFLMPPKNFSSLIKGAAYVASDCHKRDTANANRDQVVQHLREAGFRIDGLGKCMRSPPNAEGIGLPNGHNTRYNLMIKREVISNFMFYMAFENSLEPGYVTEKPFDALISGIAQCSIVTHLHSSRKFCIVIDMSC